MHGSATPDQYVKLSLLNKVSNRFCILSENGIAVELGFTSGGDYCLMSRCATRPAKIGVSPVDLAPSR